MGNLFDWLAGRFGSRRTPAAQPFREIAFHRIYPVQFAPTAIERQAVEGARLPGVCPICGHRAEFAFPADFAANLRESLRRQGSDPDSVAPGLFLLRETGACSHCRSVNRERQIAHFLNKTYKLSKNITFPETFRLFNAESTGVLHHYLARNPGYVCSEYLGPDQAPGALVDGIRNEDLQHLSFADNSLDLVITRDVFEHIPDPYQAHREVWRVLKPGGRHVFSVPFYDQQFFDERRACLENGQIKHLLPPLYHLNPIDAAHGSLVYTIFALETLLKLKQLGFQPGLWHLYAPEVGIIGPNALVLEACKPAYPAAAKA